MRNGKSKASIFTSTGPPPQLSAKVPHGRAPAKQGAAPLQRGRAQLSAEAEPTEGPEHLCLRSASTGPRSIERGSGQLWDSGATRPSHASTGAALELSTEACPPLFLNAALPMGFQTGLSSIERGRLETAVARQETSSSSGLQRGGGCDLDAEAAAFGGIKLFKVA